MIRVAVLGLGAMGRRMALRLIASGHEVTVWNRTPAAAADLVAAGATAVSTPREAVRDAMAIVAMVRDDDASREIWSESPSSALGAIAPGALAIESSTLTPGYARTWAAQVWSAGGRAIEAPVSGSLPQAEAGQLIYFLGGEEVNIVAAQPVLEQLGIGFHRVGPIGAAAVVKLVTNALLALQVGAWSELLPLMQRQALDLDAAFAALSTTAVWSSAAGQLTTLMRRGDHVPRFPIELIAKDMGYLTGIGAPGDLPLSETLKSAFQGAVEAGLGKQNMSAMIEFAGRWNT